MEKTCCTPVNVQQAVGARQAGGVLGAPLIFLNTSWRTLRRT